MHIESQDGSHYAVVDETAEGVVVTIWKRGDATIRRRNKQVARTTLDAPLHQALDAVHTMIWSME